MKIKECIILEDDELTGVEAVSYVYQPAFEEYFVALNRESFASEYFQFTADPEPELIETSHEFCKARAGGIFHINQIRAWATLDPKENAFIPESNFFATFDGSARNYNCDQQIYNCRHWLKRVPAKLEKEFKTNFRCEFSADIPKREVSGLALKSGKLIYRQDVEGEPGYIYFSRETVRKIYNKYKYKRSISIDHDGNDRTGDIIVLKSWLVEDDANNETSWFVKHKVISEQLWSKVKDGAVRGFSIEVNVGLK
jgi:hypothetical protein